MFEHETELISRNLLGRLNEQAAVTLSFSMVVDGLETLPSRFCAEPSQIAVERAQYPIDASLPLEELLDDTGCEAITPLAQKGVLASRGQALCPLKRI